MTPTHRLTHQEYTVGWICALPLELTAAMEMLDERHLPLSQDPGDENTYILGRMGEHNVVMACLPTGRTGTNSAATVAAQMRRSFRGIIFGLMVGIGGGVPSAEYDIRLGDVVVSRPGAHHGGVVQYDFGKTINERRFVHIGSLISPPAVLLNVPSWLQAEHARNGNRVAHYLKAMDAPGAEYDQLYEAEYDHVGGATCEQCDGSRLVIRLPRETSDVVVHYGTIASGNQVMSHGVTRDRLAREFGVLCFETEVAGLMNDFPCIVIRGICDYADSHRNKRWQEYAAATAAAYAKGMLRVIPTDRLTDTSVVARDALNPDEQKCLAALFLTEPYDDRAKLISSKGKRAESTCEWIKEDKKYCSWLKSRSQLLWISGGPGKGKTVLSIFLTEELAKVAESSKGAKLIFYFCSNQDKNRNTAIAILRGLLFQILQNRPKLFKYILPDFETEEKASYTISSVEALWRIFEFMLRDPGFGTIYCVLDGLDECDEGSSRVIITKLCDFFLANGSVSAPGEFKLIAVSRELPRPITQKLSDFPRLKLDPDSDDKINNDIKRFISIKVSELSKIHDFDIKLRAYIEGALLERAEGTFLWAGFVANELLQKDTCTQVVETLESLPKGLPGIYGRMLLQIKEDRRNTAAAILRWVVMALRPLTLAELAVAIRTRVVNIVNSDQAIQDHVRSCGAFVEIREDGIGLVHQSARDYLLRKEPNKDPMLERFRIKEKEANFELAHTCFEYIQNGPFSNGPIDIRDTSHLRKFPLLNYAALHWPEHARRCSDLGKKIFDLPGPFHQKKSLVFENWWKTYRRGAHEAWSTPETFSLLHLASYFGILPFARKLLAERGWKTIFQRFENKKDSFGATPLSYAARNGHEAVVKLLLEWGADVNSKSVWQAAENGRGAAVRLLYERGADVDFKPSGDQTPLWQAAGSGHEAVVKLLLERGADVDSKDGWGQTPLGQAAGSGHEAVVKLLLERGADVDSKNGWGRTPLWQAAGNGHEAVVKLLLEGGADVDSKDSWDQPPLWPAARNKHEAVVKLLLERSAEESRI